MVVADGVVGERLVLAIGGESLAHRELERLADRRSGLFGNVVTVESVTERRRSHARLMRERLGGIAAIFDELFEVDLAVVVDLSPHAALELVAVEQGDLLRSNTIDAKVAEALIHDLRHVSIAYDGFLFEIQLGVGLEVHLDELTELHAPALRGLTCFTLLFKQDSLPLNLFLYLFGCHSRFGCIGHRSAYLLTVNVVAAGHHEHITAVAFDDGRHRLTSLR